MAINADCALSLFGQCQGILVFENISGEDQTAAAETFGGGLSCRRISRNSAAQRFGR